MDGNIAVVVSTYNNPEYLTLVLKAYMQQSDMRFVLYIADDGSSEATRQLIAEYQKQEVLNIRHVWHEDQGFRKARIHNVAFRQLCEDYVLLTDGDCLPMPEMVATHRRLAQQGSFLSGSRVLCSQAWSEDLLAKAVLPSMSRVHSLRYLQQKKVNRVLPLWMPTHASSPNMKLSGIHGCHLSLFRDDLYRVNGFDESFEGWGREDSDLVARLFHAGVQRRTLRGVPVWHVWHPENSRASLDNNDAILKACLQEQRQRALQGIDELSS